MLGTTAQGVDDHIGLVNIGLRQGDITEKKIKLFRETCKMMLVRNLSTCFGFTYIVGETFGLKGKIGMHLMKWCQKATRVNLAWYELVAPSNVVYYYNDHYDTTYTLNTLYLIDLQIYIDNICTLQKSKICFVLISACIFLQTCSTKETVYDTIDNVSILTQRNINEGTHVQLAL